MNCDCGGVLIKGKSAYSLSEEHFTFILEDVPAYRCERCKKVLFADETVAQIQKLTRRIRRESNEIVSESSSANLFEYT
ncbi:MAG: YgiT-type zinc finger protein [Spirochaetota bacterium]